jgi:GDP-D-mannose dehydratase
MTKTALNEGITGREGSFLAEFLSEKDYEAHGRLRRSSPLKTEGAWTLPGTWNRRRRARIRPAMKADFAGSGHD